MTTEITIIMMINKIMGITNKTRIITKVKAITNSNKVIIKIITKEIKVITNKDNNVTITIRDKVITKITNRPGLLNKSNMKHIFRL